MSHATRQNRRPILERFRSVTDLVYHEIRDEIYAWHLRPGDKLNIETIASRLQVSTMPVREALRRLSADGLVVASPHRGAWVAPCSLEQIRQTAQVRAWLEAEGMRASLPHLKGGVLEELDVLHSLYGTAMQRHDWPEVSRLNLEFHLAIHRRTNNPVLLETLQDLFMRTQRVRGLTGQHAVLDTTHLLEDHAELLAHIRAGHADACARLMHAHVLKGLGRLADYLEATYGPDLEVSDEVLEQLVADTS